MPNGMNRAFRTHLSPRVLLCHVFGLLLCACLEPYPITTIEQDRLRIVSRQPLLSLHEKPHWLRLAFEWRDEWQTKQENIEIPWQSPLKISLPKPMQSNFTLHYQAELLDSDRFRLAIATGERPAEEQRDELDLKFRPTSAEEKFCSQEVEITLYQASVAIAHGVPERPSFRDVRDIFYRHNCVVCHRYNKGLDLRRFPFLQDGKNPIESAQLLSKLIQTMNGDREHPDAIITISEIEKTRLSQWADGGFLADPPSPLHSSQILISEADVWLNYEVVGSPSLKGKIKLAFAPVTGRFQTKLPALPRGATLRSKIVIENQFGGSIREERFSDAILGDDPIRSMSLSIF